MRRILIISAVAVAAGVTCTAATSPGPTAAGDQATTTTTTIAAPANSTPTTAPAPKKSAGRVGSPAVYDEIAAETDCAELQATFDRAEATSKRDGGPPRGTAFFQEKYGDWSKIGIAYMTAADKRMRQIGCY